jgi:16S rRNA (adenine1518-N6/adenine1519-N6)-dimethyltransferase
MISTVDAPRQPTEPSQPRAPARGAPTQPSLRRLRRFGIHPDRELGQCFLIDSNILSVIARAAELSEADVVLEIGGGLGVLSEHLADRVDRVHVIEVDTRLREALLDATEGHANVTVHWGDAMRIDLAALAPAPDKLVANLPYGIAAGVLLRTVEELPSLHTWVAMVQREVGIRLAAAPGGGEYGASSVIAQLSCEVKVLRPIPRTVFHPEPNVDSVLLGMRRLDSAPPPAPALRALVAGGFAHRRKTLAGSLVLSERDSRRPAEGRSGSGRSGESLTGQDLTRDRIRDSLRELGLPENARAETLSPENFCELARLLAI